MHGGNPLCPSLPLSTRLKCTKDSLFGTGAISSSSCCCCFFFLAFIGFRCCGRCFLCWFGLCLHFASWHFTLCVTGRTFKGVVFRAITVIPFLRLLEKSVICGMVMPSMDAVFFSVSGPEMSSVPARKDFFPPSSRWMATDKVCRLSTNGKGYDGRLESAPTAVAIHHLGSIWNSQTVYLRKLFMLKNTCKPFLMMYQTKLFSVSDIRPSRGPWPQRGGKMKEGTLDWRGQAVQRPTRRLTQAVSATYTKNKSDT